MDGKVTITSLLALASQIKLSGVMTAQEISAGVSADLLAAAATYVEFRADFSSVELSSSAQYTLLAADAVVGDFLRLVVFAESFAMTDALAVGVSKLVASLAAVSDVPAFGFTKALTDTAMAIDSSTMVDGLEYGYEKRTVDQVVPADAPRFAVGKLAVDQFSAADAAALAFGMSKQDAASAVDVFATQTSFVRRPQDVVPQIDFSARAISLYEPVGSLRYVSAGYVVGGYAASDSAFVGDQWRALVQSYVAGDLFGQDYVGSAYGPY